MLRTVIAITNRSKSKTTVLAVINGHEISVKSMLILLCSTISEYYTPHEQFSDEHVTVQIIRRSDTESNTSAARLADSAVKVHFRCKCECQVLMIRRARYNVNGRESKCSNRVSEV